jgi:hypothetical protein
MSVSVVVRCDGTPDDRPSIPLGQCRSSFPSRQPLVDQAIADAVNHGWSIVGDRELCPSCTGARARRQQVNPS